MNTELESAMPVPEPVESKASTAAKCAIMGAAIADDGVDFRVWAPNAEKVYVTGSFNSWVDPGIEMVPEDGGHWSAWVSGVKSGDAYKFRIENHGCVALKNDPRVRSIDPETHNGLVYGDDFDWQGVEFNAPPLNEIVIYELHVGTFKTNSNGNEHDGTFADIIGRLPYLKDLGINAIELMPPTEFPGETSWGYNPSNPFAVEADYGGPDGLKTLIREAHRHGIAVFLDVVYNHFGPSDLDMWQFDGWSENEGGGIYFYNDWKAETPWGATRPDYGRPEVRQYLRDNAVMWIEEFRADGLRLDAVSYIRAVTGERQQETVDLPDGWQTLQWINKDLKLLSPRAYSIAEDLGNNAALTAWVEEGGAGFDTQWDAGFVHPVREVLKTPSDEARDVSALAQAISGIPVGDAFRRVIYTESHDEVANGKARLVTEVDGEHPDSEWAKRRSLQAAALVLTSPGVPMIFQGQEFMEDGWFDDRDSLDWEKCRRFDGIRRAFADLMKLRRNLDGNTKGLCGQHVDVFHLNHEAKVLAWNRWDEGGPRDSTVVVMNLSVNHHDFYEIAFPDEGVWKLRFNADWKGYSEDFNDTEVLDVEANAGEIGHPAPKGGFRLSPYGILIFSRD